VSYTVIYSYTVLLRLKKKLFNIGPKMTANMFFGSSATLEIEPKFVFGMNKISSGNCLYWKNDVVVYPAMSVIVIYNMKENTQRFINLPEGPRKVITAMDLNRSKYV